jgi:two-component system, OmpR family, sensor histidine kinase BaeS
MVHPRHLIHPWNRLPLRWKLVILNAAVVAVSGVTVLLLLHRLASPSVQVLMHDAATAPTPQMAQDAYNATVDRQVIPAVAIAAVVAIALNLFVVTLALRPLAEMRSATRRLAGGDLSVRVASGARDDIGEVARSFDDMAHNLQHLEELRQRAADDVAHELRTPLHNILGLIEGIRDGVIAADQATLERAHGEVLRLTALVDDLRKLAEARAARLHLHRQSTKLVALGRDVARGFSAQLTPRGLEVLVTGPPGNDVEVEVDVRRIHQVLHNLVDNAIRYARPDTAVEVMVLRRAAGVRVEVRNRGEEIPADVLPHIFERFVRADRSRGRSSGGAGIGLAIVRELVAAHGGTVGASSAAGTVTVWFELPDVHTPAPEHAADARLSIAPRSA